MKSDKKLEDLSNMFNPIIRGWIQYYGQFYKSENYMVLRYMNEALVLWVRRKFKKLRFHIRSTHWLGKLAKRQLKLATGDFTFSWAMGSE